MTMIGRNQQRLTQAMILSLIILVMGITTAYAQKGAPLLNKGNRELGFSGNAKLSKASQFNFDIKYGWFVDDGWEIGTTIGSSFADDNFRLQGGLFTEYNFNRKGPLVPFIGLSTEIGFVNFDDTGASGSADDATAFVIGTGFGIKYFLRPGIALTASAGFDYSIGDSLFGAADDAVDAAADLDFGIRVYFD